MQQGMASMARTEAGFLSLAQILESVRDPQLAASLQRIQDLPSRNVSAQEAPPEEQTPKKTSPFNWQEVLEFYGFGKVFADVRLENILAKHEHLRTTITDYLREIDTYLERGVGMILWGPPGTYKSSMLAIICKAIIWKYSRIKKSTPRMRYVKYGPMMKEILAERYSGWGDCGLSTYLCRLPVLLIDEIAPLGIQQNAAEELFIIVNERQQSQLPTFATTNMTAEWFAENLPQVYDRWQTSLFLNFNGESERRLAEDVRERLHL